MDEAIKWINEKTDKDWNKLLEIKTQIDIDSDVTFVDVPATVYASIPAGASLIISSFGLFSAGKEAQMLCFILSILALISIVIVSGFYVRMIKRNRPFEIIKKNAVEECINEFWRIRK